MGRLLARVLAVFAVGLGVGILAWGIAAAVKNETIRAPTLCGDAFLQSASEVIGWGAGILAVGVTTLILTLIHRAPPSDWDE
jgi:hypothetical protein